MRPHATNLLLASALGLTFSFAGACRSTLECEPGSLSCQCAADNACNEGLICVDEVCITDDSGETGETSGESTTTSSSTSTSSGDGDGDGTTGDGDGDDTTGDGDTTTTTGDGDGDGDGDGTTGDGDGDGSTTGDGDGDGDGCQANYTCQDAIPNGWQGPVVLSTDASSGCPGDWPQQVHANLGTGPDLGSIQCECSCGDPTGVQCGATIGLQGANSCVGNPVINPEEYIPLGSCISTPASGVAAENYVKIWGLSTNLDNASCPPNLNETEVDASFTGEAKTCTSGFDTCGDGGYCEPSVSGGFDRVCIYNSGTVSCPSVRFTEQVLGHTGFDDQRSCSDCTCTAPTGACTTTVSFTTLACATSGQAFMLGSGGPNDCVAGVAGGDYIEALPANTDAIGCTASPTQPQGEVLPTGTTTLCCEPV